MKKLFLIGIVVILTNSIFSQSQSASTTDSSASFGKEYFPLNDKVELIYDATVGESKRVVEYVDSLYKTEIIADNFRYTQTFYVKNDSIYLVKTEQNVKILLIFSKHAEIFYSEPALQIPFPLHVGDS